MESGGYIKKLPQSQVLDLREIIGIGGAADLQPDAGAAA